MCCYNSRLRIVWSPIYKGLIAGNHRLDIFMPSLSGIATIYAVSLIFAPGLTITATGSTYSVASGAVSVAWWATKKTAKGVSTAWRYMRDDGDTELLEAEEEVQKLRDKMNSETSFHEWVKYRSIIRELGFRPDA